MADIIRTEKVQFNHTNSTDVLYGSIRKEDKTIRDVVNSAWDAFPGAGSLDDYDINAAVASGGLWSGGFVDLPDGIYLYEIRIRDTGTPAFNDTVAGSCKGYWHQADRLFTSVYAKIDGDVIATLGPETVIVGDKAGFQLAADGLDVISTTEPSGAPSGWNFRQKLIWYVGRFFNKHIYDSNAGLLKTHNNSDVQIGKQTVTEVGGVETVEKVVEP